jgi:spore maturation protein CgeB
MISYPGHAVSTIDVANGFYRALKRTDNEIWLFDYNTRLAFYKVAFDAWKKRNPDFNQVNGFLVCASESIALETIDFVPDVVLIINGMQLHKRGYDLLRSLKVPVVIMLTESPYADGLQAQALKTTRAIAAFTNDKKSIKPLSEYAGIPVEYMPHSYDPAVHYPRDYDKLEDKYKSDLFFYGSLWQERKDLFKQINGRPGIIIGGVDPAVDRVATSAHKIMTNEEMANYYSGAKISLNHNRTICGVDPDGIRQAEHISPGEAYSLGPRAYEIAACGSFQLCDDQRQELKEVFAGSVATYTDASDLNRKVEYYLTHDDERVNMAREARARVQGCTFDNRVNNILLPYLTEVLNGRSISRN